MKIYDFNGSKNICGMRVKEQRNRLKLSQENLAAKLQIEGVMIERDSISRIEIGTRFVADYELLALCKALGVAPSYLLGISSGDENK
ncbi:MAG: helix-turn-helix transcriptional regulator [Ruminococcaceae bacterium]|nr:helix-turn-helix transcriptional regulator [Oscillospiraceae bacterium]